jgi:hydroxyacyl-ACP dehydratase HTD2-like protein with hotdog domain
MLGRDLPILSDTPAPTQEGKLENALSGFLPRSWFCARPGPLAADKLPIGHHLIYANPDLPASGLLPDGTDMLHSPGDPFVRRMWAGGSVKVHVDRYFGRDGLRLRNMACVERIKDVQLRGQDDAVKIFVTIERAMINSAGLIDPTKDGFSHNTDRTRRDEVRHEFRKRLLEGTDDTGASLVEQRQLVFMKQRSEHEMEAIRAGQMAPVKYLPCQSPPAPLCRPV